MESPRIPKVQSSPNRSKQNTDAHISSVQEVLDIVHSQQSPRGRPSKPTYADKPKMGRLGQTVPLPAISNASLLPRLSTSFGDRSSDSISRSFPPPITPLERNDLISGAGRNASHLGKLGGRASGENVAGRSCHADRPTRPHTSYGRRRAPVHRVSEANTIVIPTCPVTNEFRSSSSLEGHLEFDDRDDEIMKICKSSKRRSKKKGKERCASPVKGLLIRKSSVE